MMYKNIFFWLSLSVLPYCYGYEKVEKRVIQATMLVACGIARSIDIRLSTDVARYIGRWFFVPEEHFYVVYKQVLHPFHWNMTKEALMILKKG